MDREIVEQKLELLRRCLQRVTDKCPNDPAILAADLDTQDIVALNEAIYEHGQMTWLGDKPQIEEARVIVTILSGSSTNATPTKHQPSARIAGKGKIIGDIIFPVAPIEDWNCAK